MQGRHSGIAHLHGQIAPRHHDAVAGTQDGFQVRNGFSALDFRDQPGLVAVLRRGHIAQLSRHFHVGRILGKAHRDIVRLELHGCADVLHVLGRERGRRQSAALFVDAFVIGKLATNTHLGMNRLATDGFHGQDNQTIVQQQHVPGAGIARELLVIQAHALLIAKFSARCIQHERGPGFQHDAPLGKLAYPNLGALQVGHDGHFPARTLGCLAHHLRPVHMVLGTAMAEVQPHHVDTRLDHSLQQPHLTRGRTQGGNDLRGAARGERHGCPLNDVIGFLFSHRISYSTASTIRTER